MKAQIWKGVVCTGLMPLFMALPAAAQQSIDLTIGASHPLSLPWIGMMQQYFQPEVNKRLAANGNKYQIKWREGYGGTLYKANATLSSVSDGIADIGWVFSSAEGAKLPLAQVGNYAPAVTGNASLVMDVVNEMNDKIPSLKDEWAKNNVVFLSSTAMDTLHLFTSFPVTKLDDLKGKKIGGAGTIAPIVAGAGATSIDSPAPNMYNDLSTGLMQGVVTIASVGLSTKLYEVAPYVTKADLGTFSAGALIFNKDKWDKLPQEVRTVLKDVARDYSKRFGEATAQRYEGWFKAMEASSKNVKVIEFPAAEREKWIKGLPNIAADWVKTNSAKGLPAKQVLTAYMEGIRSRGVKPVRDWDK
jgi:TRAP-type C4-dicarboxylate transport system substrate-binding protein